MAPIPGVKAGRVPAKQKGKLGRWIATHKPQAAGLGVGGAVVAILLLKKLKGGSSSATGSTTASSSGAIDPSTGLPYSEELAAAQSQVAATAVPSTGYGGYSGGGGGYGSSGGGGGGGGDAAIQAAIAAQDAQIQQLGGQQIGPAATPTPIQILNQIPPAAQTPAAQVSAGYLTPAQATAAVNATAASGGNIQQAARTALAAEAPASSLTPAQRHAQEVANRATRAVAKRG